MRRIQVTDCRTLVFPPAQVFTAVADLEHYPRWWPAELKVRLLAVTPDGIGSRLEAHPYHSLLVCEVTRLVANSEIHIRYVEGVQRGTGVWTFEPSDEGTRLCYRVDLEPQGWFPRFLSNFLDFTAMHSRLMNKVFDGLEKWLATGNTNFVLNRKAATLLAQPVLEERLQSGLRREVAG